jgi:hypothetical protein
MTAKEKQELEIVINQELDKAEKTWKQVGHEFVFEGLKQKQVLLSKSTIETQIPGFPFLEDGVPKVDDFIAFVFDIRNSTDHLLVAISAKATQLERVLYETTAVNTLGSIMIEKEGGGITEFLGDGFLALFKASERKDVYSAHKAAKACMEGMELVNKLLKDRYELPPLSVGIGMAFSKAIVTIVGTENNLHPKALGECVYRASKIACGVNQILVDEKLKLFWPKSDGGILRFNIALHKNKSEVAAYKIDRTN